jgi:hypothetical protein
MQVAGVLMPEQAISIWQLATSQTAHRKGREGRKAKREALEPISLVSVAAGSQAELNACFNELAANCQLLFADFPCA